MNIDVLPENLEEAIDILKGFFSEHIEEIKKMTDEDFTNSRHFSSGMFIRNSWNLWWRENHGYKEWSKEKPKLVAWFNSIDIVHADDMSSIIMTSFHRNLTGSDYKIDEQVERYKKHWREAGYPDGIPKN